MINRASAALILILMISISAYAQDEAEPLLNSDDSCDYLLLETESKEECWELDFDLTFSESLWIDTDEWCDILLGICIDLEVTDEEIYEIMPELWEDDWYY